MTRKTYKEMQKELKQQLVVESLRKKKIKKQQQQQALVKRVKDLRFKQSKIGRTIATGKVVFKRIGAVTKGIGEGFEKATKSIGKSQQDVSKPQRTLIGSPAISKPMKKKKKPFNINKVLAGMPQ